MTSQNTDLRVPVASIKAILDIADRYYEGSEGGVDPAAAIDARRVAAPVVAAELRRIADEADAASTVGVVGVIKLRRRADELDPLAVRQED